LKKHSDKVSNSYIQLRIHCFYCARHKTIILLRGYSKTVFYNAPFGSF